MNWCYSTPRLFCNYCCQISACSLSFKNQIFYMPDQSHLFQIAWNLCSVGCTTKTTFFKNKKSSTHKESAWGLVWRNPKGFLISTMFRGSSNHFHFDHFYIVDFHSALTFLDRDLCGLIHFWKKKRWFWYTHCYTGCICLTFPQCAFSNVSSNGQPARCQGGRKTEKRLIPGTPRILWNFSLTKL